jgi:NAD(P)-dependent dehydrogenase (short-subunit alcohol dehydrogenase family)
VSGPDTSRVWLITGASSGFGAALSTHVLSTGARVVGTVRKPGQIAEFAALAPGRAQAVLMDVTDAEQVRSGVQAAQAIFGRLDVLVNNAGYGFVGAIEEASDAEVRAQFDTNVFGLLSVTRQVLPIMRAQGSGHIVNISSIAGLRSSPGLGIYAASKHAVEGLSEALAAELSPLGIRVTVVEPGAFRTNWAGSSMRWSERELPDYAASSGRLRQVLRQFDGHQGGDPVKAAAVIARVVASAKAPLHLPLGEDAVAAVRARVRTFESDLAVWEAEALATAIR